MPHSCRVVSSSRFVPRSYRWPLAALSGGFADSVDRSNQGVVGDYSASGAAALDMLCDGCPSLRVLDREYVRRHRFCEILLSEFDERGRTRFFAVEYSRADLIVDTEAAA